MAIAYISQKRSFCDRQFFVRKLSFIGDGKFILAVMAGIVTCIGLSAIGMAASQNVVLPGTVGILSFALYQPVLEEFLFRGIIQEGIYLSAYGQKSLAGISFANFCTSLLFVAAHLIYHPPLWAIVVFIPSLIFGYFRDRYDNILPPIMLHCFYNWMFFTF